MVRSVLSVPMGIVVLAVASLVMEAALNLYCSVSSSAGGLLCTQL
jgi:hypothetical protein